jgi:PAS domain-containing protein
VALLLILAPSGIIQSETTALGAALTAVAVAAVASLFLLATVARRAYQGLRELRGKLYQGDFEAALDVARRSPAVGQALGFESAVRRMLEFDARRAEKTAAATRLLSSILHEADLPLFIADLDDDLFHLSRAACQLFGANVDRVSLMSVLLLPANREFAQAFNSVVQGERARADAVLTLHLPARRAARDVALRMLPVQGDEGTVLYVLGLVSPSPPRQAVPAPPPSPGSAAAGTS